MRPLLGGVMLGAIRVCSFGLLASLLWCTPASADNLFTNLAGMSYAGLGSTPSAWTALRFAAPPHKSWVTGMTLALRNGAQDSDPPQTVIVDMYEGTNVSPDGSTWPLNLIGTWSQSWIGHDLPAQIGVSVMPPIQLAASGDYWIVVRAASGSFIVWDQTNPISTEFTSSFGFNTFGFYRDTAGFLATNWTTLPGNYAISLVGNACDATSCMVIAGCPAPDPAICDDGIACTDDICDAGACAHVPSNLTCDDGNACTSADLCASAVCAGLPIQCADGNPCTTDSCDPGLGCLHAFNVNPCDDGAACTLNDVCAAGVCVGQSNCDDSNPCTVDACANGACSHIPFPLACDDGNACTSDDGCVGGTCQGVSKDCSDGNACTDDPCAATTGVCSHVNNAASCDDGDAYTGQDACADGVCAGGPVPCDDGDACTWADHLSPGGCIGTVPNCSDGDACTDDACSPVTGLCSSSPKLCADSSPCTADSCDAGTGACVHAPVQGACTDGSLCTGNDACVAGVCVGTAKTCVDGNPCTQDSCEEASGNCVFAALVGSCDDGDPCTEGDHCVAGNCTPGAVPACADASGDGGGGSDAGSVDDVAPDAAEPVDSAPPAEDGSDANDGSALADVAAPDVQAPDAPPPGPDATTNVDSALLDAAPDAAAGDTSEDATGDLQAPASDSLSSTTSCQAGSTASGDAPWVLLASAMAGVLARRRSTGWRRLA